MKRKTFIEILLEIWPQNAGLKLFIHISYWKEMNDKGRD